MRIAILSYHFHTYTAEALVTSKLARAFVESGHQITVFTSTFNNLPGDYLAAESGPLAGMEIYRIGPNYDRVPRLWRVLHQISKKNHLIRKAEEIFSFSTACTIEMWAWVRNIVRTVVANFGEVSFDILHSRINPPESHLAGLLVKRETGLPWCAYFSDPYPHHLYPPPYQSSASSFLRYRLEISLDSILTESDSCIFPSAQLKDYMLSRSRRRFQSKAFDIPHIANTWRKNASASKGSLCRIRYSGFLTKERKIDDLYDATREFFRRTPAAFGNVMVEFAGRYEGNQLPSAPSDLQQAIQFHRFMEPDDLWLWMQESDVFLLVEAKLKEGIFFPSKLADYLGGNRPILALSPTTGVVADFLKDNGGIVVEPDDVEGIASALEKLYNFWQKGRLAELAPTPQQIHRVSPDAVVPQYEKAFQYAIDCAAGSRD